MSLSLKIASLLLSPFILIYTLIVFLRNKMYDWKWLKSCAVDAPVISVGNVQIGGTGKTPMVEYLAENLLKIEKPIVILSRGYRRFFKEPLLLDLANSEKVSPELIGDEPYQLMQNLPGVKLAIDADRCKSAERVLKKWSNAVLILDDGFQHRRIVRDLDIVMLDITRWSNWPVLYPLTTFRDGKSSLRRATLVVLMQGENNQKLKQSIQKYLTKRGISQVFNASLVPIELCPINTEMPLPFSELKNLKVGAFCGIANPDRLINTIIELKGNICVSQFFRDHHHYKLSHIEDFIKNARANGADVLITTQKDAVKITSFLSPLDLPCYYVKIKMEIKPKEKFFELINRVLN